MLSEAYLGLGSNLGDRAGNIERGLALLREVSAELCASSLYETVPQGFASQPPFINAVCGLWTRLDPFQLMAAIRRIEASIGRHRAFVNAPRTLDIDVLLFDTQAFRTPALEIPHPRMAERAFVLTPLAEIAPGVVHPVLRKTARSLLASLPADQTVVRKLGRPASLP